MEDTAKLLKHPLLLEAITQLKQALPTKATICTLIKPATRNVGRVIHLTKRTSLGLYGHEDLDPRGIFVDLYGTPSQIPVLYDFNHTPPLKINNLQTYLEETRQ